MGSRVKEGLRFRRVAEGLRDAWFRQGIGMVQGEIKEGAWRAYAGHARASGGFSVYRGLGVKEGLGAWRGCRGGGVQRVQGGSCEVFGRAQGSGRV